MTTAIINNANDNDPIDRPPASAEGSDRPTCKTISAVAERELNLLGKDKAIVEAKLADPSLYKGPAVEIALLNRQLADLDRKIAAAEAAWIAAEEAIG